MLNKLSLFSGIGGDDLASEWAGIKTVCMVEKDKYCQGVLKKNFSGIPIIEDVRDVTKEAIEKIMDDSESGGCGFRETDDIQPPTRNEYSPCYSGRLCTIDIISGGFPCQPHSVAGQRKGSADERNLWPEFRRVIGEIRPRWVVAENVPGILSSDAGWFFRGILGDLSEMGYAVGWCTFGAVDVGALHKRDRVFIVGYSKRDGYEVGYTKTRGKVGEGEQRRVCESERTGIMADSTDNGFTRSPVPVSERRPRKENINAGGDGEDISYSESPKCEQSGITWTGWKGFTDSCYYREQYWQSEPNVGRVANGISSRVDRLKGLGNAVVPQQIYPIYKAIVEIENKMKLNKQ